MAHIVTTDKSNDYWDSMYDLAKEYYEKNGDLIVPIHYVTDDGKMLGRFIDKMRKAYRGIKGFTITKDQIRMLDKIGMEWRSQRSSTWDEMYSLAIDYYKKHGRLNLPISYETEDNKKLGRWIYNMQKKRLNLSNAQIEKLRLIGIN